MANLIQHDTFEPYYSGRDKDAEARAKAKPGPRMRERPAESEIVLPEEAPAPVASVRRERRVVAH